MPDSPFFLLQDLTAKVAYRNGMLLILWNKVLARYLLADQRSVDHCSSASVEVLFTNRDLVHVGTLLVNRDLILVVLHR